jgi:hypothetical protein
MNNIHKTILNDPFMVNCLTSSVYTVKGVPGTSYKINNALNPCITLVRGRLYKFIILTSNDSFFIKTVRTLGNANLYNVGVTGQGATNGFVFFKVPATAPDNLYYQSGSVQSMGGTFNIINPSTNPLITPTPTPTKTRSLVSVTPTPTKTKTPTPTKTTTKTPTPTKTRSLVSVTPTPTKTRLAVTPTPTAGVIDCTNTDCIPLDSWLRSATIVGAGSDSLYCRVVGLLSGAIYAPKDPNGSQALFNGIDGGYNPAFGTPPASFCGSLIWPGGNFTAKGFGYVTSARFIIGENVTFENWEYYYPNQVMGTYKLINVLNDGNVLHLCCPPGSTPIPTPTPSVTPVNTFIYSSHSINIPIGQNTTDYIIPSPLALKRGVNYDININTPTLPFALRLSTNDSNSIVPGTYANDIAAGKLSGTIMFTPNSNTPDTIVYVCTSDISKTGTIQIIN